MPAVETLALATPGCREKDFDSAAKGFPDSAGSDDNFDRVMQATLAPRPGRPSATGMAPAAKNPAGGKSWPPAGAPTTSRNRRASEGKVSTGETDSGQKAPAASAGETTPAANNSLAATDTTEPLPVFLSLPLFLSGVWPEPTPAAPVAEKSSNPTIPSTSLGPVTPGGGNSASAITSLAGQAVTKAPVVLDTLAKTALTAAGQPAAPVSEDAANTVGKTSLDREAGPAAGKNEAQKQAIAKISTPESPAAPSPAKPTDTQSNPVSTPPATASPLATGTADEDFDFSPASPAETTAIAGTGVATMVWQMKNPQNATKVAGPDVKELPVDQNADASEKNLPTPWLATPVRAAENNGGTDLNSGLASGNHPAPVVENATVLNAVDLPTLADARMRALERTHDMLALHSMRLAESTSDSLSVVIKPAVGTELSLELRQHPDGVEARATLTRGDREFLSGHWPELQQRLEQRGIKLAPLGGETNFSTNDSGHFQQRETSPEDTAQEASAFAEFAAVSTAGGATARLAAIHEGWESWA